MNQMTPAIPSQTMSSIDLLKIINDARAKHGEVTIRLNKFNEKIEDELDGDHYTKSVVQNLNNTESVVYHLNKDQCTLVAMRESKGVRRNVLDQLNSLKAPNRIELAQWVIEAETKLAQANEQLAIAAPKVDYYDAVVERTNLLNATQVAQKVKLSAFALNRHLDALGVYNNTVKRSRVFQQWFVDKGYGLVRQTELGFPQAMFTLEGEAWVVAKLVSEGVAS